MGSMGREYGGVGEKGREVQKSGMENERRGKEKRMKRQGWERGAERAGDGGEAKGWMVCKLYYNDIVLELLS